MNQARLVVPLPRSACVHQSSTDTTHAHHSAHLGWVGFRVTAMLDGQLIESAGRFAHYWGSPGHQFFLIYQINITTL